MARRSSDIQANRWIAVSNDRANAFGVPHAAQVDVLDAAKLVNRGIVEYRLKLPAEYFPEFFDAVQLSQCTSQVNKLIVHSQETTHSSPNAILSLCQHQNSLL